MKKLLLVIVALAMMGGARGQDSVMRLGPESGDVDRDMLLNAHYLGPLEGLDIWLTRSDEGVKGFVNQRDWHLVKLTEELFPMERVELPHSQRCKILGAVGSKRNEDGIHKASVLLVDSSAWGRTSILRARLSLDTLRLEGGRLDTVDYYTYDRDDRCQVWCAVSPNEKFIGVLTIVQYMKSWEYMSVAKVFDENFNLVWKKDFAVGATNGIYLDDNGVMYTLGAERVTDGMRFVMSVMNSAGADTYGMKIHCDPVHDFRIVNVVDNHVLCAGLFTVPTAYADEDLTSGLVTMSFDVDSMQVEGFSMRYFQNEDMNIMLNKNTKKIQYDHNMSMVAWQGSLRMPYGAVVAVGHHHMLHYTNSNGTVEDSWYAQGLHLLAFDTTGIVKWARNIRRNDVTYIADGLLDLHLFAEGDKICILRNEDRKEPEEYNITKEAREYEVGDKSNLVLYTISPEGDVAKKILEKETKHVLANVGRRKDGTLLLLTVRGNKCRMVELKDR